VTVLTSTSSYNINCKSISSFQQTMERNKYLERERERGSEQNAEVKGVL
jgi:hypothetical protein